MFCEMYSPTVFDACGYRLAQTCSVVNWRCFIPNLAIIIHSNQFDGHNRGKRMILPNGYLNGEKSKL